MRLSFRPTTPADFGVCAGIIRDKFIYDETTKARLLCLWDEILRTGRGVSSVIEDGDRLPGNRVVAFGLSLFVSDEFIQEAKTCLPPYIGRHILERWSREPSPILSLDEIRRATDGGGLNVLVLHYGWTQEGYTLQEVASVQNMLPQAFIAHHRGYHLKEFLQEVYGEEDLAKLRVANLLLRTDYASLLSRGTKLLPGDKPYLVGITREEATEFPASLALMVFVHSPPRLHLTIKERVLLRHALDGRTDEELAQALHVSVVTVKKRWEGIYDRVIGLDDELMFPTHPEVGRRGAEKRRRLLAYLRAHPEELRP